MKPALQNISRYEAATAIAILFHGIGLIGLLLFDQQFFIRSTPFNLVLSFLLLIWTQETKSRAFIVFAVLVLLTGFFSEAVGVNTGLLFGEYTYGKSLGIQWLKVPVLIGINWFIIIYCCGISTQTLLVKIVKKVAVDSEEPVALIKAMTIIADGATLAVAFDWLMEPVAVKLGFWTWNFGGDIPLYNYLSWLVVSMVLLTIFHFCRFSKQNKFAVNLLLIQALFFLILRTFLK